MNERCVINFSSQHVFPLVYFQDITALERLCSQFSEKCFILGDQIYPRPEKFLLAGFDKLNLNGATLKLQQMTAVTDMLKASRMIHGVYRLV